MIKYMTRRKVVATVITTVSLDIRKMDTRLSIALALVILFSGCPVFGGQTDIITITGTIEVENSSFRLEGTVENQGQGEARPFDDVAVILYTENETLIESAAIGTLERRQNVSMHTDRVPAYVIVYSPEFWQRENVEVDYFTLGTNGRYSVETVTSPEGLPIEPESHS